MPNQAIAMNPVMTETAPIERTLIDVGGRPVVLFHKSGQAFESSTLGEYKALADQLNYGPVVELDEDNDWKWCQYRKNSFNCHSLAIGSAVGIGPEDWLEGKASERTLGVNPAQILLDEFYSNATGQIQDNDVFVLRNNSDGHLVHSGFVRVIDGNPMAISKFGEGPILLTTLELIAAVFGRQYDEFVWYRLKTESATETI